MFYGTYLEASVPQCKRITDLNFTGTGAGSFGSGSNGLTYSISSIQYVYDQIILQDEATADIIQMAAAGEYNVHTESYRTWQLQLQPSPQQNIICPFKVNMAKNVLFVFQNLAQRSNNTAFFYDSNCGYNIFASIGPSSADVATKAAGLVTSLVGMSATRTDATPGPLTGVGYAKPLLYSPSTVQTDNSTSCQLRIGNEQIPPIPLTCINDMSTELAKVMGGWGYNNYSPEIDAQIISMGNSGTTMQSGSANNQRLVFDCLEANKFSTCFVHHELLDDQTITANYCQAAMYSVTTGAPAEINNGMKYLCPRGFMIPGVFEPPSSSFILGFNTRAFSDMDGIMEGMYFGNNTITLNVSGAVGLIGNAFNGNVGWRGIGIVPHHATMRYLSGGQLLWQF